MLSLWDTIGNWFSDIQKWILDNGNNHLFWLIIFFVGLIIGTFAIHYLNKDK